MASLMNLARMSTATTGTGTITLGSAISGCLSFSTAAAAAGVSSGDTIPYGIEDGANSEIGYGVWTSPNTLTRVTILASTNGGSAISLSGTAEVFCICPAEQVKFRGARVKKSVDQTAANYVTPANVAWDAEDFDTDGFHDTVTANDQLVIPSGRGIRYAEVSACIATASNSSATHHSIYLYHNSDRVGQFSAFDGGATSCAMYASSGPRAVAAADVFVVQWDEESDSSITIVASDSWFAIRVLG